MYTVHVVLAVLDLVVLIVTAVATVLRRHRRWAWLLLLAAGAWLPLNNDVLEGPVLVSVIGQHGLTVADLIGIGGALLAGSRLWARAGRRRTRWVALSATPVAVALVGGFLVASFVTDVRVDDGHGHHRHHHLHHHRPTALLGG